MNGFGHGLLRVAHAFPPSLSRMWIASAAACKTSQVMAVPELEKSKASLMLYLRFICVLTNVKHKLHPYFSPLF